MSRLSHLATFLSNPDTDRRHRRCLCRCCRRCSCCCRCSCRRHRRRCCCHRRHVILHPVLSEERAIKLARLHLDLGCHNGSYWLTEL